VCLGLGSLVDGSWRISEVQLALLLEIGSVATAYDPVFTGLDIEFLASLGIRVEKPKDWSGNVLYYMPHCDRSTNEEVISNIMAAGAIGKAVILGNDLRNYTMSDVQFKQVAPRIYQLIHGMKIIFR
jgi:hypothetical protein